MTTDRKTALELVDRLYELRSDEDIEGMVGLMTDDFVFNTHAPRSVMSFAGVKSGREEVIAYFKALDQEWAFEEYEIKERIVDGDRARVEAAWQPRREVDEVVARVVDQRATRPVTHMYTLLLATYRYTHTW